MAESYFSMLVFDFETGGYKPDKNAVTELAVSVLDGKTLSYTKPVGLLAAPYYDPKLTYEQQALDVTGISIQLLEDEGVPIKELVQLIVDHAVIANPSGSIKTKPLLVGHNVIFDIGFLIAIFNFCKVNLSKYVATKEISSKEVQYGFFDTMHFAQIAHPTEILNHKLGTVAEFLGIEYDDGHRAAHDVKVTAEVASHYLSGLRGGKTTSKNEVSDSRRLRYQLPL